MEYEKNTKLEKMGHIKKTKNKIKMANPKEKGV
jgi:hypothetical protein